MFDERRLVNMEPVSAVSALYQGEKADQAGTFNVSMAMMGIAAAYALAVIVGADKFGKGSFPWIVVIALPIPLWFIAAFHSLLTLNAMMHGVSVQILEDRLFRETGLPLEARNYVGSKGADRIMDIRKAHRVHKFTTYFVYGGVAFAVVFFTIYLVFISWSHSTNLVRVVAAVGYIAAAMIVGLSWFYGLEVVRGAENEREVLTPTT
jgi:hypothetical protein